MQWTDVDNVLSEYCYIMKRAPVSVKYYPVFLGDSQTKTQGIEHSRGEQDAIDLCNESRFMQRK